MQLVKYRVHDVIKVIVLCFTLFSLSPCTVKEVLYDDIENDFSRPLNKSKTTATNSCSNLQSPPQQQLLKKISKISLCTKSNDFWGNPFVWRKTSKTITAFSVDSLGNSPPKYILFKRLKVDIA